MDAKLYEMYLHHAYIESKLNWHVYYVFPSKTLQDPFTD